MLTPGLWGLSCGEQYRSPLSAFALEYVLNAVVRPR